MKITMYICDVCTLPINGSIYLIAGQDVCSDCLPKKEECPHEENISDAVPGRDTARLICKECGYDRVEEVA